MEEQPKEELDSLENIPQKEFTPTFEKKAVSTSVSPNEITEDFVHETSEEVHAEKPLLNSGQLTIWGIIEAFAIVLLQQALMVIFTKIFGVGLIVSASLSATAVLIYYILRVKIFNSAFKVKRNTIGLKDNFILIAQGIFLCFLVMLAYDFILKLLDYTPKAQNVQQLFNGQEFSLIAAYFMLVYSAPVWEEIVFRGILQDGLQRSMSPFLAVVTSGFIFGLIHFDPDQMIPLILLGFIFGWMYVKSESVFPCIIAHSFVNTVGAVNLFAELGK